MSGVPDHRPACCSADEVRVTGEHLASLQLPSGMIPWFPGGHCDPWNHVESAMALDVAGLHDEAERRLRLAGRHPAPRRQLAQLLPARRQRSRRPSSTPTCAPTSPPACGTTGAARGTAAFLDDLWPTVERALDWVLAAAPPRRPGLWAVEADARGRGTTRCSPARRSIQHALRCGAALGRGDRRARGPTGSAAADRCRASSSTARRRSSRRTAGRWTGTTRCSPARSTGEAAKARLADGWDDVRDGRARRPLRQRRAVGHGVGDGRVRDRLRRHRRPRDGDRPAARGPAPTVATTASYWTGLVYPAGGAVRFPVDEHTSYTAAAVILAADAITGASPASALFTPRAPPGLSPVEYVLLASTCVRGWPAPRTRTARTIDSDCQSTRVSTRSEPVADARRKRPLSRAGTKICS